MFTSTAPTHPPDPHRALADFVWQNKGQVYEAAYPYVPAKIVPPDAPRPFKVTHVYMRGTELGEDYDAARFLELLRAVPTIDGLSLYDMSLPADFVAALASMPWARSLKLFYAPRCPLDDAALRHLEGFPELDYLLSSNAAEATDEGWQVLSRLPSLTKLSLESTSIGPKTREALRGRGLKALVLAHVKLEEGDLAFLSSLSDAEDITLTLKLLTNATLDRLRGLSKLKVLRIQNSAINDAGLEALHGLKSLEQLNIGGNKLSRAAVAKLRAALPRCKIIADFD